MSAALAADRALTGYRAPPIDQSREDAINRVVDSDLALRQQFRRILEDAANKIQYLAPQFAAGFPVEGYDAGDVLNILRVDFQAFRPDVELRRAAADLVDGECE